MAPTAGDAISTKPVPKLMDIECQLLHDHEGCFKCRRFYVSHCGNDCPNGFPDPTTCKPLTEQQARTAVKLRTMVLAPITVEPTVVASVLPLSEDPSSVLGNGSNSDGDNSCVPSLPTFCDASLFWYCHINGPALPHSVAVKALIDDGAQVVLICKSLTCRTGLRFCPLHAPYSLGTAFDDDDACPEQLFAMHWVKLALSSWDSLYTSRTVRAFVCPDSLVTPLVLGLPFLSHNRFVIDHELRTCIEKDTGYDIIADCFPSEPLLPPLPYKSPKARHLEISSIHSIVQHELKAQIAQQQNIAHETTSLPCWVYAAAVCTRIEQLAGAETLR